MPIIGVTHDAEGRAKISRTVTTKVAIGLPPAEGSNFPKRLDHFTFLKKIQNGKDIQWVPDPALIKHYGENAREFWIVFLDDDPDQVFRTEYASYVKRGKWCCGDGVTAKRRDLGQDGKQWGELKVYKGPCAEGGCPNLNQEGHRQPCAPSGDLYFMLAEFPTLGSICRIHTSSYQSIKQIHSAIQDLRHITGGRLMGVTAKLFMYPDKNVFEQGGQTKVGTKWVMGLELKAKDLEGMQTKLLETARVFQQIKGELSGQILQIEDGDEERGTELTPEFYPQGEASTEPIVLAPEEKDPEQDLIEVAIKRMVALNWTQAQRDARIGQYRGRIQNLIDRLPEPEGEASEANGKPAAPAPAAPQAQRPADPTPGPATKAATSNVHGLNITDEDLGLPPLSSKDTIRMQLEKPKKGGFDF